MTFIKAIIETIEKARKNAAERTLSFVYLFYNEFDRGRNAPHPLPRSLRQIKRANCS